MDARIKLAAITTARKSNNIIAVPLLVRERLTAGKVQQETAEVARNDVGRSCKS
jgi:hypothetical protein